MVFVSGLNPRALFPFLALRKGEGCCVRQKQELEVYDAGIGLNMVQPMLLHTNLLVGMGVERWITWALLFFPLCLCT